MVINSYNVESVVPTPYGAKPLLPARYYLVC